MLTSILSVCDHVISSVCDHEMLTLTVCDHARDHEIGNVVRDSHDHVLKARHVQNDNPTGGTVRSDNHGKPRAFLHLDTRRSHVYPSHCIADPSSVTADHALPDCVIVIASVILRTVWTSSYGRANVSVSASASVNEI
jgi:hypothetical protein